LHFIHLPAGCDGSAVDVEVGVGRGVGQAVGAPVGHAVGRSSGVVVEFVVWW
jgi:hypothetical protein